MGKGGSRQAILWLIIRELKERQRRQQQKWQKTAGLYYQNNNITLFCTFLSLHCTTTMWKCLISHFVKDGNKKTTTFFFFSWTLIQCFRIQLQKKIANIWQAKQDGISAIKFEAAEIHFLVFVSDVLWPSLLLLLISSLLAKTIK